MFLPVFSDFSRISEEQHSRGRPSNNVTIENNQWTGANTGNTYDDNVFMALGSTLHFQGSASDLIQVNCANRMDSVSGTVYNMPISYLFEHGSTGLALQSIREDGSGNKRTNCPVFSWGEGEPRLEELAEFTSKTHVRRPRSRRTRQ